MIQTGQTVAETARHAGFVSNQDQTSGYEAALRQIDERAIIACPGCGNDTRWTDPTLVALPEINAGTISDQGLEAFAIACHYCGHIRLFAVPTTDS